MATLVAIWIGLMTAIIGSIVFVIAVHALAGLKEVMP